MTTISYSTPPITSPASPPRIPPITLPAPGTTDPAAIPTPLKKAAKIALVAAFGNGSPNAKLIPKSIKGPMTGILAKKSPVNPNILLNNEILALGVPGMTGKGAGAPSILTGLLTLRGFFGATSAGVNFFGPVLPLISFSGSRIPACLEALSPAKSINS